MGGHAEFVAKKESGMLTTFPKGMSYAEAAPILEGSHYALFYIRAAKVGKGTKVLINGATGAIGSAALQIMHHLGADIIATARKKDHELVKKLGAKKVIDYETEDFTKLDETFDVILDAVGKRTFAECRPLLTESGLYTSSEPGPNWQNPMLALKTKFIGKQKVLFPIPSNKLEDMEYIKDLVVKGHFTPVVDRTYEFDDIVEATKYAQSGQKVGSVVITIPHGKLTKLKKLFKRKSKN